MSVLENVRNLTSLAGAGGETVEGKDPLSSLMLPEVAVETTLSAFVPSFPPPLLQTVISTTVVVVTLMPLAQRSVCARFLQGTPRARLGSLKLAEKAVLHFGRKSHWAGRGDGNPAAPTTNHPQTCALCEACV